MAINKKLINFATRANFDQQLANSNIDSKSIVFINDTQEIWTHGTFFSGAPSVKLQTSSPGTTQTGHLNISGNGLFGGKVGIGTTTPLSKLSINGGLHVGGDSDAGDNNILADGTITGLSFIGAGTGLTGTASSLSIGGNAATATKLASITTSFTGTYPVTVNVSGTIYSHTGLTFTGSTGTLTANTFIGDLSGTATNATTATTASKVLLHSGNEVNIGGSLASGRLYVNYNDGGNFTEYGFYNGGTSLAKIYASTFFGELSGNASSATALTTLNVGSSTNPIYFSSGKPEASAYSFGNASGNIPISNGTLNTNLNADLLDGLDSIYYKKGVGKGSYYKDVVNVSLHNTAHEILIKTKIPFISSSQMPLIHLEGYAYGANSPIEIRIAFYIYSGAFVSYGCTSTCPWDPDIKLFTYVEGSTTYVGIALIKSIYFPQCSVNYIDIWGGGTGVQSRNYSEGWTVEFNTVSSPSIVPSDNLVSVPYKPIANNITGNASTASKVNNSLSLKFDTGTTEGTNLYTFDGSAAKTIDIKAGTNVTLTKAAGIITISSTDTNTVYTHPTTSGNLHIPSGGTSGQILRWSADGTATWGSDNNTTYNAATSSTLGLSKLFSDTVQSVAANTLTTTASRTYGVQVNSSGQLVVNVPWVDTDNNTTYSQATSSTLGLVKLGSDTQQTVAASSVTATASRSYAIQLNSSGQMLVNVPWTDNNTTYAAGTSSTLGLMKLFSDTVQSVSATSVSATASRTYGVQVNSSGQLVVNVPWTDSNTTYSNFTGATASVNGANGLVPAPTTANYNYFLKGTGGWSQIAYSDLTGTVPTWNQSTTGNAATVTLTADNSTNATNYLLFADSATGNKSPRTDTGLTYNPSTGILTSNAFSGSLSGTVNGLSLGLGGGSQSSNVSIGSGALNSNTSGYYNTAIGTSSLYSNLGGNSNTANGRDSLYYNTSGNLNTAIGFGSLFGNTTGNNNTALGYYSGRYLADGAASRTTGNNGLYLGYNSKAGANATDNEIVIGYNAIGNGSNTVTIGNSSITDTYIKGKLHVSDSGTVSGITNTSQYGSVTTNLINGGYSKLPSGIIMQYGRYEGGSIEGVGYFRFPIDFPTETVSVNVTVEGTGAYGVSIPVSIENYTTQIVGIGITSDLTYKYFHITAFGY